MNQSKQEVNYFYDDLITKLSENKLHRSNNVFILPKETTERVRNLKSFRTIQQVENFTFQKTRREFILKYDEAKNIIGKIKKDLISKKEVRGLFGQEMAKNYICRLREKSLIFYKLGKLYPYKTF